MRNPQQFIPLLSAHPNSAPKVCPWFPCTGGSIYPIFIPEHGFQERKSRNASVSHQVIHRICLKSFHSAHARLWLLLWDLSASFLSSLRGKGKICLCSDGNIQVWLVILHQTLLGSAWCLDFIDAGKGSVQLFQNPSTGEPHLRKNDSMMPSVGKRTVPAVAIPIKNQECPARGGELWITSQNVPLIPCSEWGNWECRSGMQAFPTFPIFSSLPNSLK